MNGTRRRAITFLYFSRERDALFLFGLFIFIVVVCVCNIYDDNFVAGGLDRDDRFAPFVHGQPHGNVGIGSAGGRHLRISLGG